MVISKPNDITGKTAAATEVDNVTFGSSNIPYVSNKLFDMSALTNC